MNRQSQRFCQSGFSLIEVLITVLIIAIGLMGFAAMMLNSMKNNRVAMQRSLATAYAYDIIDCMRTNQSGVANGDYETVFTDPSPSTIETVAKNDLKIWKDALSSLLPLGQGQISFDDNTVTVEIRWIEAVNAGDTNQQCADPPVPPCHKWDTQTTL